MSIGLKTLVQCPYCKTNWLDEAHEFVCNDCAPKVEADMIVYDIHKKIQDADKYLTSTQLKERLPVLRRAHEHLGAIIKMISKEGE